MNGKPIKLEVIEVERRYIDGAGDDPFYPDYYPQSTPITPCVRCSRLTEDRTYDLYGGKMPDHLLDDRDRNPLCEKCASEDFDKAFEADVLEMLERKLGLAEKHRDALRSFIETIFTDPKKIVQLADLDNRVKGLERQNTVMWAVIGGLVIALLAVVVALVIALVGAS